MLHAEFAEHAENLGVFYTLRILRTLHSLREKKYTDYCTFKNTI